MLKLILSVVIQTMFFLSILCPEATASRRSKPWPIINLSTLPSVVGAANSWVFEINQRSPVYLADLDKMYVSFAYGWGSNDNSSLNLDMALPGYKFFNSRLGHKIRDFKFNIYSNLGRTTFGSLWASYGKKRARTIKESIVVSTPFSMKVKAAFAWKATPKITLAVSGSINNWPRSLVFVFQPKNVIDTLVNLPADVGENLIGEFDLLYRPNPSLDIIVGGIFQHIYTKFNPERDSPFSDINAVATTFDTLEVKEYIYSGAPKLIIKKTFPSGGYIRVGGAYYFNLFDYQYEGSRQYKEPSPELPCYRPQELALFIPKWKVFADRSTILGNNIVLNLAGELGRYPNALDVKDTEWTPVRQSLVNLSDLTSGSITFEINTQMTRILNGMAGIELRFTDKDDSNTALDDRSIYVKLRLGTTTRFYRNLWWSVRLPNIRLYTSEALGSAILFQNDSYIETEILFIGL